MSFKKKYKYTAYYNSNPWSTREFTSKKKLFNHLLYRLTNENKATNLTDKIVIEIERPNE